nr:putative cyclin-b3-1 [Quercus suber]
MVTAKGKFAAGLNRVGDDSRASKSVGVRNLKVYVESEAAKADADSNEGKSVIASKRANLTSVRGVNNMEKSKGKLINSASTNVRRKALADVSNAQGNSSRKAVPVGLKLTKSKSERTSLQRVSMGPGGRTINVSSRKSFTVMGLDLVSKIYYLKNVSQGVGYVHTSKRDSFRNKTMGQSCDSVVTNDRRTIRTSLVSNRKSLPVLKRVTQAQTNIQKENAESSDKGKEISGYPVPKAGKKVASRINNRSHLWQNRMSDGFLIMGKTNAEAHALTRKSVRPTVKTTLQATLAQRTLKSKNILNINKSTSVATISSKNKEEAVTSSISKNAAVVVPHEATQGQLPSDGAAVVVPLEATQGLLPSDGNGNPSTVSDVIPKKSKRRRSYTSLLMAGSKLLEGCGEVMKLEKLPSIDDNCNQLEVAEYVDEIYQYYWVTEAQNPSMENYMSIQTDITAHMRGILINWLIEVHFKFDLMQETLYLMVTLLDRYLSQASVKKNEMQLVGLTALLLASKYEDFWHPRVKDLISISAESYTRDQMLAMERLILKQLKFRLNVATPYVFMLRFLKAAQSDSKLEHLAFYLIELCLVEHESLKFKPSLLCASALYVARCTLHMTPAWTPLLCKHARYEESQLRDCAQMIIRSHKAAGKGQLRVSYEKSAKPNDTGKYAVMQEDLLNFILEVLSHSNFTKLRK